ncbi:MAG: cytochrome C oxidase subunit IV family protein [Candidatus Methylomirabilaceae bacterium]
MSGRILPPKTYYLVFAALLLLTLVTVEVAFFDMGLLSFPIALAISTCKALIVILYFMHLRYSSRLTWIVAGTGFFWLFILIALTMSDYLTRAWPPVLGG